MPIPLLLYAYLLTEMLAPFFAGLLVLNAILFLGRLLPLLEIIFDFGIGLADFLRICAYISPKLLLFSIPMASLMGVVIAFTRMTGDHEVMALKASGIGLYRMLPPVLLLGIITALVTYATATTLIPKGTVAMHQLFYHLAKNKIDQGIQEKTFSEGLKDAVLYVEKVDPQSRRWQGVYLSDLRDKKSPLTVIAESGGLKADLAARRVVLELADGTLHRAVANKSQTIHFKQYRLDLPLNPPQGLAGDGGKNALTQAELLATAASLPADNPHRANLLIEYQQRMALPVGCLILTILGLALAMTGRPSQAAVGVPLGLAAFIAYYILLTAAKALAEGGRLPIPVAMWLPNLLFAGLTLHLTIKTARELDNPWLEQGLLLARDGIARLRQWRRGGPRA